MPNDSFHCRAVVCIALSVCVLALLSSAPFAIADQTVARSQEVLLTVNDVLLVMSNRTSIQSVLVQGNLSVAALSAPSKYPADSFGISSSQPSSYDIQVEFDFPGDYSVQLATQTPSGYVALANSTYYLSGGPFQLNINLIFNPRVEIQNVIAGNSSPWQSFLSWLQKFGEAFPAWVKVIYMVFGVQFSAVGALWIRREKARKESFAQHLDAGNKAFFAIDVAYKFLLASFLAIVAIMGGEIIVLFVLRFMFLATFDLLSLWDLFVVCFAAGVVVIGYFVRFILERAFDLKPIEDE